MAITEADRHRLHQALVTQLGEAAAATLMEHLPPVGWADVATKTDLAHLQTAVDTRFDHLQAATKTDLAHLQAVMDTRLDGLQEVMDTRFETLRLGFEASMTAKLNSHLRWMISTMVASYAVLATLAALLR